MTEFGSDLQLGGRMTARVVDEVTVSLRSVADNVYRAVGGLSSAPTVVFKEEAEEEPEGRPGEDESGKTGLVLAGFGLLHKSQILDSPKCCDAPEMPEEPSCDALFSF